MNEFLSITRALSDEGRVRILLALQEGELCACQLIELLALAPSTVSRHLAVLRQAGLVTLRKEGRWIYYSRAGRDASPLVRSALSWLTRSIGESKQARRDRQRLAGILACDKEELCRLNRQGR